MLSGMFFGVAIVFAVSAIYLIAASMGAPTVKDGLVLVVVWAVTMVILSLPGADRFITQVIESTSDTVAGVLVVIALAAFAGAVLVAWRRFREQVKALQAKLPEPPKTSFKRVVARGPGRAR